MKSVRVFFSKVFRNRKILIGVGAGVALILIVQLVFPYDRAFLGVKVDGVSVGLQSKETIAKKLTDEFLAAKVTIKDTDITDSLTATGASINANAAAEAAVAYPIWQRLLPFSFIAQLAKNTPTTLSFDAQKRDSWQKEYIDKCSYEPINASAEPKDGQFVATLEKEGRSCDGDALARSLSEAKLAPQLELNANTKPISPQIKAAAIKQRIDTMNATLQKGVVVHAQGKDITATKDEIIQWIDSKAEGGNFSFLVDPTRLAEFGQRVAAATTIPAKDTIITKRNNKEVSRTPGVAGKGVDIEKLKKDIANKLSTGETTEFSAESTVINPRETVINLYSADSAGLSLLLKQITDTNPDMAITIRSISGPSFSADSKGGKQYSPASTYKLGVAYAVLKRVQSGAWKTSDSISGTDVGTCLQRMIHVSDNACAEAFGQKISWKTIQDEVRAIGMSNTVYWGSSGFLSTTNDQVTFLEKLQKGQLLDGERTTTLLDLMKNQIYRQGVPAGVGGAPVADKVGFLDGLLHDSAIVYSPRGTYAISVYSVGGSWANIADATRQIEANLSQ